MHKISTAQFRAAVELDPAWASKLTEPVEITGYCDMTSSEITHLSPLLHFTGTSKYRESANFSKCKSLKIAEGRFQEFVNFAYSGIEKIGDLTCGKNDKGYSTDFLNCKSLKVAEGNFKGYVSFWGSGIERIGDLSCGKDNQGIRLDVRDCNNLKSIPFTFNPKEVEANPRLVKDLTKTRAFIQKKRAEIVEIVI